MKAQFFFLFNIEGYGEFFSGITPFIKQHTPKGNLWKWERKLYGQVRKSSPIYSLNLFLEFVYTF